MLSTQFDRGQFIFERPALLLQRVRRDAESCGPFATVNKCVELLIFSRFRNFLFFFVSCDNDLQDQYCKLDDYSCLVVKQLRHLHATGASFSSIFGFMSFSFLS